MKKKKHPKDMTGNELLKHLFHPKVVKHIKNVARHGKKSMKKA
jgi:hypothetical protein